MNHFHSIKDIKIPFNRAWSTIKWHMSVAMIKSVSLTYLITYDFSSSHLSLKIYYRMIFFQFKYLVSIWQFDLKFISKLEQLIVTPCLLKCLITYETLDLINIKLLQHLFEISQLNLIFIFLKLLSLNPSKQKYAH